MVEPKLEFERISKAYTTAKSQGSALAVRDFSLRIAPQRFVCLLGPSGCGKSTLLNMAAGFVKPSSGRILVDGRPIAGPGADRGMVFQEYALFPWFTVLENVEIGPKAKGVPAGKRREIAERFIAMVGLAEHRHKYPRELSGGMKQRAAIARTLANEPGMILMDEPFGALDAQTREALQDQLLQIWAAMRNTVVFVTHSINEAVILADEIAILAAHPGRLVHVVTNGLPRPRARTAREVVELERQIYEQRYVAGEPPPELEAADVARRG
jgi:NitT/TauT family transport system ATP-binding protein